MTTLGDLLIEQRSISLQINRLVGNYKKLGSSRFTAIKTKNRIEVLQKLWDSCQQINTRLRQTATPEELNSNDYFVKEEFFDAQEDYMASLDVLTELLDKLTVATTSTSTVKAGDISLSGLQVSGLQGTSSMSLPHITIPKFSGDPTKWESFRDSFESLVVENASLSNTQRFYYLKSFITGDASFLVENIKITDANYDGAWKILKDEFDGSRTLVHAHIQAFADLPVMKSESAPELKRLRDIVSASLSALTNLQRPVDTWGDLLVFYISQKFSAKTRSQWNLKLGASNDYPTYQQLRDFMTERIRGLDQSGNIPVENSSKPPPSKTRSQIRSSVHNVNASKKCPLCSAPHLLAYCAEFKRQSVEQRYQSAKQVKCCFNCLRSGHFPGSCPSQGRCNKCKRLHHTLLHREFNSDHGINERNAAPGPMIPEFSSTPQPPVSMHSATSWPTTVLLATAWVVLRTTEGRTLRVRALLDQGSEYTFISESLAQSLYTRRQRADLHISGFGAQYSGLVKSSMQLTLEPCNGHGPRYPMTAYIFQKITAYAASKTQPIGTWSHLHNLQLADPNPSSSHPIHLLIGADIYGSLLCPELRKGPFGTPTAQLTVFGWIVSGPAASLRQGAVLTTTVLNCVPMQSTDALLRRFWEIEEVPSQALPTEEESQCEEHFVRTHSRTLDGRYVVRLPFKNDFPINIGDSFATASVLYDKLERRLAKKPGLAEEYHKFLSEYHALGHMKVVDDDSPRFPAVYIPHHPVVREGSSTTHLRVVFNASSITSNGTTLNDHLLIGPKLQCDLAAILLRWRCHRFVYTADIAKMFRQILIHRNDVDFQRILWRSQKDQPVQSFQLLTVTYGTAPAPYLSMRVLRQLTTDEGSNFPAAVPILHKDIYVDDVLFGSDDMSSIRDTRSQLNSLLSLGGFHLRKWASNAPELLKDIPAGDHELAFDHPFDENDSLKVLGLTWLPMEDSFCFQIATPETHGHTKRSVLSLIARLFDPLGWITPVVISAKILMQDLWVQKGDWDDVIPEDLRHQWVNYCTDLSSLRILRIPRWTGQHRENLALELHGFSDASNRAYAAAVYCRVLHSLDNVQISLLTAKSKVAPLKTLSIPRLELSGAVLLTKLLEHVRNTLNLRSVPCYGWIDSTVALAWIRQHPSRWKTFVANRVSDIHTRGPDIRWNHVDSKSNPADCASRGISAENLIHHPLWWSGPLWLRKPSTTWPSSRSDQSTLSESNKSIVRSENRNDVICHSIQKVELWDLPNDFSSWPRLLRATASAVRFISNLRRKRQGEELDRTPRTTKEIFAARNFWISLIQQAYFSEEIKALQAKNPIPKSSPWIRLNPFIGKDDLLRLGGRLKNSFLQYNEKHPILLPRHRISQLIVAQAHQQSLHGGTQLTLKIVRQNFWITGARSIVKEHIKNCVTCTRYRENVSDQLMGDLPSSRVTPSAPFLHTGVDYAGPMQVLPFVGRGQKPRKYYVAIFVCLVTKAIHLEYVDDYATSGFLAAFRRFVSRRGLPSDMYSDNGTNFRGADRELNHAFLAVRRDPLLRDTLTHDGVSWHFMPAAAPHFGGLWEAGVKSFKYHLKRVVGAHTLAQIEFETLLCQIEACLNSRPLTALTDDPECLEVLTPGHFLIGRPLVSVPEHNLLNINENRLSRWQRVQAMKEHMWRSWSHDYLHSLHQRNKWQRVSPNICVGEIVLLKNNLLPPSKWAIARVTDVHPGEDGYIRVVTIRTAKSTFTRPITQLCRLPIATPRQ